MPKFVWTAKDKFGKSAIREIAADTAEQSKAQLLTDGWTELELIGNEIHDVTSAGFAKTIVLGEEVKVTTEQKFKHRGKPPMTFSRAFRESVFQGKGLSILIILLALYEGYRGNKISVILLGCALLIWQAFVFCVRLPSIYYAKLNEAKDWNRWEEVLELVETLKTIRRNHIAKGYLCCVAAKQGDLLAAKKYFEQANEYLTATKETELIKDCKQALG